MLISSPEKIFKFVKKISKAINMVALGKAKRNDEKFCNLYFICLGDKIIGYLASWKLPHQRSY